MCKQKLTFKSLLNLSSYQTLASLAKKPSKLAKN